MRLRSLLLLGLTFLVPLSTFSHAKSDMIQIKGSDTLINLVQRLSESYMAQSPAMISITGGGSGNGIAALINNTTDLANSSREIKPKEAAQAKRHHISPIPIIIALDGICVITHKHNPVKKLTLEQLGKIFKGEITNWKQVGGAEGPISLYGRQSNSGTFSYFREDVLKGEYAASMKQMNGNSQIVEAIERDKTAIGYVGLGYAKENAAKINTLLISTDGKYYANPLNPRDIAGKQYPLVRPLYQYAKAKPAGAVLAFIQFELGKQGQAIVAEEGFVAVPKEFVSANQQALK